MTSSLTPYPSGSVLDQLYQKYHDAGFSPLYMLQYFVPQAVCALLAMTLNGSLVWVTLKSRSSLNCPFNVFIAFESFSASLYSLGFMLTLLIPLSGQNVVSYKICILTKMPSFYGVYMQTVMMLFISLERLSCLIFPIWYKNARMHFAKKYITVAILTSFLYGTFMIVFIIVDKSNNLADKYLLCNYADYYGPAAKPILYQAVVYTEVPIVCIYGIIWLLMLKAMIMRVEITNTYNMHILKSLSVIMAFIIAGFVLNAASPYFIPLLGLSPMDLLMLPIILNCITILASAGNGPILYIFSSNYRKCYQDVFPWLIKREQQTPAFVRRVAPASSRTMTTVNTIQRHH